MRSEKDQPAVSRRPVSRVKQSMTPESIRAQVRKIIASKTMARSGRLARVVEFTVSQTLDGHGDQLKEFVIGVEVFDRKQDYDPRLDPIVRVEARRLRMKLRKYYETEGLTDRLTIEYPKGGYCSGDPARDDSVRNSNGETRAQSCGASVFASGRARGMRVRNGRAYRRADRVADQGGGIACGGAAFTGPVEPANRG